MIILVVSQRWLWKINHKRKHLCRLARANKDVVLLDAEQTGTTRWAADRNTAEGFSCYSLCPEVW
uniref:Uncharacterized protein n=1 Tax=Salmonella sp. TaxID=599 RepID=A0A482EU09_SALSP|nr:hypothetical protein NNIBIDOC_00240 [Salmonella sp.]